MSTPIEPTHQQDQVGFERMRGPEWPDTLHDLMQAVARMGVVTSAARAIARGERVEARGAIEPAPVRALERPARREGARPFPARRRDDAPAVDFKSRAAGERDDE